ncbi:MAG: hypothetical protein FJW23_04255 [Acidimicrobiia bacterium]|nr:hypothetical protein [Acidimicrobiia bacterium]
MRPPTTIGLAAALAGLLWAGTPLRSQGEAVIGTGPISHIAVSVRDVDVTATHFSEVFDLPVPKINNNNRLAQPDGSEPAVARTATFHLPNFLIEVQQPATTFGPIHDQVEQYGQSVHHISFGVAANYPAMRDRLIAKGGTWRGGTAETTWAYVDLRPSLGVTFEPIARAIFDRLDANTTRAEPADTLGTQKVTRVGIVVRDIVAASAAYGDILGVRVPPARSVTGLQYPEGSTSSRTASIRTTSWTHDNGVAIELIEPVGGPSPWSRALDRKKGNAVHHLTFDVGSRLSALISRLQAKGGTWTYGGPGGATAYIDFTETLGFVVDLTGTR